MNVIPFIDVMLVLLAIVLTTATFVAEGRIPVDLPTAPSADPPQAAVAVEIAITADGALHIDGRRQQRAAFVHRLATLEPQTRLLLRVDAAVAFRHFVAVVDALKAAGLRNVSIVTEGTMP
ncbi:MAG: biopolymer transporter ExbD [Gammaproteobacteria bacterium]|nr:biopolymer transporter ExbD [Gammaproteobacteria bacterium]